MSTASNTPATTTIRIPAVNGGPAGVCLGEEEDEQTDVSSLLLFKLLNFSQQSVHQLCYFKHFSYKPAPWAIQICPASPVGLALRAISQPR